jgi:hypothetical protein
MNLDYTPQFKAAVEQLASAATALKTSWASPSQKLRILKSSLRAAVSHVLTMAPVKGTFHIATNQET